MSSAFLALWNDYPAAMTEEYEAWHTFEHVPERLTAPGLRAARRYGGGAEGEQRYFTLYELQDLTAVEHPAYMDLVRNPSVWSQKMRRHFSNVLRIPASTVAAGGHGIGSHALIQAYSVDRSRIPAGISGLDMALRNMVSDARILGFRIGRAEPNQLYEVFTQDDETDADTFNIVLIIEATSRRRLAVSRPAISGIAQDMLQPRKCLRDNLFDLLVAYQDGEFPSDRSQVTASKTLRLQFDGMDP